MKAYSDAAAGSANMTPFYSPSDVVYFDDNLSFSGTCAQVTFAISIRDGGNNLIRNIASTTYNVGTTGPLNLSTDIFNGTQSWSIPASGSTGDYTARIAVGSTGINNEYFETQLHVVAAEVVISGTAISARSITESDYTKITCTTGTLADYAITTIINNNVVKGSKEMDVSGTAAEVLFHPWEIGTCTGGTVQITAWKGGNSARDNTGVLTVANGTGGPESQFHQELFTCLRATAVLVTAFGNNIDFMRGVDLESINRKLCPAIFIIPDITASVWENVAQYKHNTKVGILVVDVAYPKRKTADILEFVQDYGNTIRDVVSDYDWKTIRQPTVSEGKTGGPHSEDLLYYYLLTVEAEVII